MPESVKVGRPILRNLLIANSAAASFGTDLAAYAVELAHYRGWYLGDHGEAVLTAAVFGVLNLIAGYLAERQTIGPRYVLEAPAMSQAAIESAPSAGPDDAGERGHRRTSGGLGLAVIVSALGLASLTACAPPKPVNVLPQYQTISSAEKVAIVLEDTTRAMEEISRLQIALHGAGAIPDVASLRFSAAFADIAQRLKEAVAELRNTFTPATLRLGNLAREAGRFSEIMNDLFSNTPDPVGRAELRSLVVDVRSALRSLSLVIDAQPEPFLPKR